MSIDKLLLQDLNKWSISVSNELGRLTNGIRSVTGSNDLQFIKKVKFL